MSRGPLFVKHFTDPAICLTSARHWAWLHDLKAGIRLPMLMKATETVHQYGRLVGRHAAPSDLPAVAVALARLHTAAYLSQLRTARLDQPHPTAEGWLIQDFWHSRRNVLRHVPVDLDNHAVAFYKDANLRNFLITDDGELSVVDFDQLTLAPFGYDLAKFVVSLAMTYGQLHRASIESVLHTYNRHCVALTGRTLSCPPARFQTFCELHHLLTARFLGRNNYHHPWPRVRPWPDPLGAAT